MSCVSGLAATLLVLTGASEAAELSSARKIVAAARFSDGEPLSRMKVDIGFRPIDDKDGLRRRQEYRRVEAETDADGRFEFELPAGDAYEVIIDAWRKPPRNDLPHDTWTSTKQTIAADQTEIEFVCDRSSALDISVKPKNELPKEIRFTVELRRQCLRYGRLIRRTSLDHNGGRKSWSALAPGNYTVEVQTVGVRPMNWSRSVIVEPSAEENRQPATVEFPLPELTFGSLLGKVQTPHGKPGANLDMYVWLVESKANISFKTDSAGRFLVRGIPTGPVSVSCSRYEGNRKLQVEADKTTSVGVLKTKLRPRQIVSKRLASGTFKFSNGTPIEGAGLGWRMGGGIRMYHPVTTVESSGRFEYQFIDNQKYIGFQLERCPPWLKLSGRQVPRDFETVMSEIFYARVDGKPGEDIRLDVTLPDPGERYGDVTLRFENFPVSQLYAAAIRVELANGPYQASFNPDMPASGAVNELTVRSVPPGRRTLYLSSTLIGLRARCEKAEGSETVVIDGRNSGIISVHPSRPVHDLTFRIRRLAGDPVGTWASEGVEIGRSVEAPGNLISLGFPGWDTRVLYQFRPQPLWKRLDDEPMPEEWTELRALIRKDGTVTLPPIGIGKYQLQVSRNQKESDWVNFEVERGARLRFDVPIADNGSAGVPRRRE